MHNNVFGEVTFGITGWRANYSIMLWGNSHEIIADAEAFDEADSITVEQEESFESFKKFQAEKQERIELLLMRYFGSKFDATQLSKRLTPRKIKVEQDGCCAMLFDDEEDPDNGIAVIFIPEEEVMTQDEYL